MAASIHHKFLAERKIGQEFIEMWNSCYMDGAQEKLAKHFDISIPTVYRIRKQLGLPDLHSLEHPGKQKAIRKIKRIYYKGLSTLIIGKEMGMCPGNVQKILHEQHVRMRPQHVTNALYYKTRSSIETKELIKMIRDMYLEEHMPAAAIAKKLRLDPGTVATKLKCLGIPLRQNHNQVLPGGYPCQWCNTMMDTVYQTKGPRKQKYCCHRCKNKAKDYRRMLKGQRVSEVRMKAFDDFLKEKWGAKYSETKRILTGVKPIVNTGHEAAYDRRIVGLYKQCLSIQQIADKLGISTSTVNTRCWKHLFRNYKFFIKYCSHLSGKWKKMGFVETQKELDEKREYLKRTLGYEPDMKLRIVSKVFGERPPRWY